MPEARTRLIASRDEAAAGKAEAERAVAKLAPAADLETRLAGVRDDIAGKRAKLAEVQAEQQAIVREAELADRRLSSLAADKAGWVERQDGAAQPDRHARSAHRRRPSATAPNWKTRRRFSPRSAAR